MDIQYVITALKERFQEKKVRFVVEQDSRNCEKCLQYNGKIYKESDPDKPILPIHPNCRCTYEEVSNPDMVRNRLSKVESQVREYARIIVDNASELCSEAEYLFQEAAKYDDKINAAIFSAKVSTLGIAMQYSIWGMEKMDIVIKELQSALGALDDSFTDFSNEFLSLAEAPVELYAAWRRLHYSRLIDHDQWLENLPGSPKEAVEQGFIKAKDCQNWYHRNKGQLQNTKYYNPVTGQEIVYNEKGMIVLDPENIGTKNYEADISTISGMVIHWIYDVFPYWIWGNSKNDTTPFWDRIWGAD